MADQFTNQQGTQPATTFTKQEEDAAAAFGLNVNEAGLEYQAYHPDPAFRPPGIAGPLLAETTAGAASKRKVVDAFVDLSNMGPDDLVSLQHKLYDAGLYDASFYKPKGPNIHFGELDNATVSAYQGLISQSVRSNGQKTPDDILKEGADKGYGADLAQQVTPKPPPLTIQLTDPNDLLAIADATARKVLGRKLTDAELRNYVDTYHTMEAQAQQSKYHAEYSEGYDATTGSFRGPGGVVTAAPSPADYALSSLRAQNPQDAKNVEMEHGMDVFHQLIGGGSGGG